MINTKNITQKMMRDFCSDGVNIKSKQNLICLYYKDNIIEIAKSVQELFDNLTNKNFITKFGNNDFIDLFIIKCKNNLKLDV